MERKSAGKDADGVVVATSHGPIKGRLNTSVYDDTYYSFEKVPFATPPLGKLRFKAPVPAQPWTEVLNCTENSVKPLQKNPLTNAIEGSEDCLYLNVYVKKLKSEKPLPVMIFLFGGGFEKGDPTRDLHGPDYFMMKDVVLVTVSYRLGPMGFLCLQDPALNVPGNAGLKDQLLALRWIAQNAANFNGDPSNITLFGESAGAAAAHYLMCSPHAKGLFHKAILMSGNILCPWAVNTVKNLPFRLAQASGWQGDNTDSELLEYLQAIPGEKLLQPYLLTKEENLDDRLFTFGPVVEPYDSEDCLIPQSPEDLITAAASWANDIPLMIGGTSFEGLLMYGRVHLAPFLVEELRDNCQHMLPLAFKRNLDAHEQRALAAKIRDAHFGDQEVSLANVLSYCDYTSYKIFWHPILRTVRARLSHARSSDACTYLYRFDYDSPEFNHQRIKYCGKQIRGVAHVDDLSYLFYGTFAWKLAREMPEFKTIARMIDIWTSFAENANPNCPQIGDTHWQPLTANPNPQQAAVGAALQCLNIGAEVQVIDLPEMEKLKIWDSLYAAY